MKTRAGKRLLWTAKLNLKITEDGTVKSTEVPRKFINAGESEPNKSVWDRAFLAEEKRIKEPALTTLQYPRNRNYVGGGLMVWAGIMLDGRTPLHVFESDYYRAEVLVSYVPVFRSACGPEFIIMDDAVRPHTALLVDE
ncbi:DDE_3 domain-containing protein [Trichonephila clavipes]|nr:DDE_3 domain-containing protein [Trichonephila clavipes]